MKLRLKLLCFVLVAYAIALAVAPFIAQGFGAPEASPAGHAAAPALWFVMGYATSTHLVLTGIAALVFAHYINRWPAFWTLGVVVAICITLPRYFSWLLLDYTTPEFEKPPVYSTVIACTVLAGAVFYLLQRFFRGRND